MGKHINIRHPPPSVHLGSIGERPTRTAVPATAERTGIPVLDPLNAGELHELRRQLAPEENQVRIVGGRKEPWEKNVLNNQGDERSYVVIGHPRSATQRHSLAARSAVAIGCVLIAFGVRYRLTPVLGEELPFMLFIAAVLVAAWYGGAVMGFVALGLGLVLARAFLIPSTGAPRASESLEILRSVRYLFTASIGIFLIELLHRGRRRTQAACDDLEQEVARRKRSEEELLDAQAQLAKHADQLERRVVERTAKLEATVQSLQDILYHIAHNLRAPLRSMEGYASLLLEQYGTGFDATGVDYARRISHSARQMDDLIQDLLRYGRLGHSEVNLAKINLEEVVQRALSQLAYQIKNKRAEVIVTGPLPSIRCDASLLNQILINLLDNALKFVAPGVAPRIQVRAEERAATVRLIVEDNGIGVEPQYHERIFRAFERLHTADAYEGTGIGLAIVKEGMQRLNGSAGIESQPGQGSRFWVEFRKGE